MLFLITLQSVGFISGCLVHRPVMIGGVQDAA